MSKSFNVVKRVLYDIRDSKPYTIRKLADGNCWMTEDLKIGGTSNVLLEARYSDNTDNFTVPASNTALFNYSSGHATIRNQPGFVITGNNYYYNAYAYTAGSYNDNLIDGSEMDTKSICPKNWRIPSVKTGVTKSYINLAVDVYSFKNSQTFTFPVNITQNTGLYYNSAIQVPSRGSYYSGTTIQSRAYTMATTLFNASGTISYPNATSFNVADGSVIRCVAR